MYKYIKSPFATFWLILLVCISAIMIMNGCRKVDQHEDPTVFDNPNTMEERFFLLPASVNPKLKQIVQTMQKQNETLKFAEPLMKKAGYPRWDKARIQTSANQNSIHAEGGEEPKDTTIIFVPFTLSNTTSAVLTIAINLFSSRDTAYNIIYPPHYKQYGFDTTLSRNDWNSRNVFNMFAQFEKSIFDVDTFRIDDARIFGKAEGDTLGVKMMGTGWGTANQIVPDFWDMDCEAYIVTGPCPPSESRLGTESLSGGCLLGTISVCEPIWVQTGPTGGGGYNVGGNNPFVYPGGGGTPGGLGDIDEIPVCPVAARMASEGHTLDPCAAGWVPIPIYGDPGIGTYNPFGGVAVFNNNYPSGDDIVKINTWKIYNIDTLDLDSCRQQLLKKLIDSLGTSPLGIFLSKLDKAIGIPNTLDKFFVHFKTRPLNNHIAFTEHATYDEIAKEFEVDIVLDSTVSKDATDIFIANTLFHEVIHAYMTFIWKKLNQGATQQQMDSLKYDQVFKAYVDTLRIRDSLNPYLATLQMESIQHNYMADQLLDYIANTIKKFDNNPNTQDHYYWYLAWSGLTRKQVRTWKEHWPNFPNWPPSNPSPSNDSTRGLKYALTLSRIDSIYNKVLENEEKSLPGAKGRKPVPGGCY